MRTGAIIVAGGKGLRAGGGTPKQLQMLGARRVYEWSVEAFRGHPAVDHVVLVVPEGGTDAYAMRQQRGISVVSGGASRAASVRNGLSALGFDDCDVVMIHDAARPGLEADTISKLLDAIKSADAVAPALSIIDAVKRRSGDTLSAVSRDELYRIQTPQTFRYGTILKALLQDQTAYTDDLEAIEATGGKVHLIEGSERLSKITYPGDLERMSRLLGTENTIPRMGSGYDVHAFEDGIQVTLCGVSIPHTHSLKGHSDADVAWHALTDAILGAAALGDIGDHFPPSDPKWKNTDSAIFLKRASELVREAGFSIHNCDITIICETPKVNPHREQMRQRTADVLGLPLACVSVKATTTEGLGFTGRREGIAAQAVAILSPTHVTD